MVKWSVSSLLCKCKGIYLVLTLTEISTKYAFLWKLLPYLSFGDVFCSCFCLKLWFWIWGGTNYRGGVGQVERRGRRKKETHCHTTKQAMEDEKEVICPEVWFDFHNEYLLSCFALFFLNFHFSSAPIHKINSWPPLVSLPRRYSHSKWRQMVLQIRAFLSQ